MRTRLKPILLTPNDHWGDLACFPLGDRIASRLSIRLPLAGDRACLGERQAAVVEPTRYTLSGCAELVENADYWNSPELTGTPMRYWLMKSEPDAYSIDNLAKDKSTHWNGVRNYQARNFMRDQMALGDPIFFYHSNCEEPGIVGIAEASKLAYPDASQFDRKSKYYDPESSRDDPRWLNVDIRFVKRIGPVSLAELRQHEELANMRILQRGNRLSITPVDPAEWKFVLRLSEKSGRSR